MQSVLNAYIVHNATAVKKLSHRIFRRDLGAQLVQFIFTPVARPLGLGQLSLFRLTARYFPRMIQPKPKQNAKTHNVNVSFALSDPSANSVTLSARIVMLDFMWTNVLSCITRRRISSEPTSGLLSKVMNKNNGLGSSS
ncbi:hypothetical protein PoB_001524900 [Plakobranchus ocellatus]|uniref:Uncharacterized protein n=1 Tax=Plakobranchus ocellatus TaxID=259542 RepID=A0AAV3Z2Y7_9GAST|nr:hypothetical protein PoB_001524900 [Plakobranchus ocellatus]